MAGFKAPDFNERAQAARDARQRALETLRNKPVADPAVIAERQAKDAARTAAEAEKRAAKAAAIQEAKAEKERLKAEAEAAALAAAEAAKPKKPKIATPEEMKAARDARYAARKARQR
jgi:hypothetical protein